MMRKPLPKMEESGVLVAAIIGFMIPPKSRCGSFKQLYMNS
jgi:hypothetical protein